MILPDSDPGCPIPNDFRYILRLVHDVPPAVHVVVKSNCTRDALPRGDIPGVVREGRGCVGLAVGVAAPAVQAEGGGNGAGVVAAQGHFADWGGGFGGFEGVDCGGYGADVVVAKSPAY